MIEQLSGYDVGALMYCPAHAHGTIAGALLREQYPKPFSLAFCLEDTVPEALVEQAEGELYQILQEICRNRSETPFYLPLIFVRVRSPQQLRKLAAAYRPFSSILRGFILPKFFVENCGAYIQAIRDIAAAGADYRYMPIFESPAMLPLHTRYEHLAQVKEQLGHRGRQNPQRPGGRQRPLPRLRVAAGRSMTPFTTSGRWPTC